MTASFGAMPLDAESYTRDALGRIVTRVETIEGTTTTWEYGYDAAGRLETVTKDGALASQYAYDANGNRLVKQTPTVYETGTYDAQDRMLTYAGASYTYTANGETLTKTDATGTTSYQYDVFGNLLGVDLPNGTQIRYKVDGRNRRIERSVNGVVTQRWLWQGQLSPIAELNASNAVVSRFVYATRVNVPDSMIRGGVTYRVLTDHLGSPRLIVNTSTGAIAQRMDFDEWGIVTTDTNPGWQPFGFAGGMTDTSTRRVRFGMRDYDAALGRWTVGDPARFRSMGTNAYLYSFADPLNFNDPQGLSPCSDFASSLADLMDLAGFQRLSAAIAMLMQAALDPDAPKHSNPTGGFRQELVANDQAGQVYRHVLAHAGAELLGDLGAPISNRLNESDLRQARLGRLESQTELLDNLAGHEVGSVLSDGFEGTLSKSEVLELIREILCDPSEGDCETP